MLGQIELPMQRERACPGLKRASAEMRRVRSPLLARLNKLVAAIWLPIWLWPMRLGLPEFVCLQSPSLFQPVVMSIVKPFRQPSFSHSAWANNSLNYGKGI